MFVNDFWFGKKFRFHSFPQLTANTDMFDYAEKVSAFCLICVWRGTGLIIRMYVISSGCSEYADCRHKTSKRRNEKPSIFVYLTSQTNRELFLTFLILYICRGSGTQATTRWDLVRNYQLITHNSDDFYINI